MSSGSKFSWLNRKSKTYPKVNFIKTTDHAPLGPKPVTPWGVVKDNVRYINPSPGHQVAKMLNRVAMAHPHPMDYGFVQYFAVNPSTGHIVGRCVIGALILELPDGKRRAEMIMESGHNGSGIGAIAVFLPTEWVKDAQVFSALVRAQYMNDKKVPWATIAGTFARTVNYNGRSVAA